MAKNLKENKKSVRKVVSHSKKLVDDPIDEFLHSKGVSRDRHLNHQFEDAVEMAKVLKSMYPRYVQLHNYNHCSSLNLKMYNWNYLNDNVLRKIHMEQDSNQLEALARARPGAIQALLSKLAERAAKRKARGGKIKKEVVVQDENMAENIIAAEPARTDDNVYQDSTYPEAAFNEVTVADVDEDDGDGPM